MQHNAAHHLHIEVPHAQRAPGRFSHQGEGFRENVIEGLVAVREGLLEGRRARAHLFVGERPGRFFQFCNTIDDGLDLFDVPLVLRANQKMNCFS